MALCYLIELEKIDLLSKKTYQENEHVFGFAVYHHLWSYHYFHKGFYIKNIELHFRMGGIETWKHYYVDSE